MPRRKKNSGLLLYSLLKKEVSRASKDLKKPLTGPQQKKLIKEKLFPKYKEQAFSRIKKGGLHKDVTAKVKTTARKRSSASKVYGRLLHEVTKINKRIPDTQKLSISQRRRLISETIYPKLKGKSYGQVDWAAAITSIIYQLSKQNKDICDVTAVQANAYQDINYFEIDTFLTTTLPPCVFVEVNAGGFGRTDIFNTKDYNYYDSGVQHITNAINKAIKLKQIPGGTDKVPKYFGELQIRPGHENDNNPESYYLTMILVIDEVPVEEVEPIKIPRTAKSERKKKRARETRKYINERLKRLKTEKSKVKPIRRKVAQAVYEVQIERKALLRLVKAKVLPKKFVKDFENAFHKEEKKKLDAAKRKKVLKEYQYKELLRQINNAFKK